MFNKNYMSRDKTAARELMVWVHGKTGKISQVSCQSLFKVYVYNMRANDTNDETRERFFSNLFVLGNFKIMLFFSCKMCLQFAKHSVSGVMWIGISLLVLCMFLSFPTCLFLWIVAVPRRNPFWLSFKKSSTVAPFSKRTKLKGFVEIT